MTERTVLSLTVTVDDAGITGLKEWGIEGALANAVMKSELCEHMQAEILAGVLFHLADKDHIAGSTPTLAQVLKAPHLLLSEAKLQQAAAEGVGELDDRP